MSSFPEFDSVAIKICNYKSFGDEPQGFDELKPINLLVGRNNSGKSALLDLVQFCCEGFKFSQATNNGRPSTVKLRTILSEDVLTQIFRKGTSGGTISGDHWNFASNHFLKKAITINIGLNDARSLLEIESETTGAQQMLQQLPPHVKNPFQKKLFRRLAADRDISQEGDGSNLKISQNGTGFTNVIQRYINQSSLPNALVEREFLAELNRIFQPDATFTNIRVRQHEQGAWEIYLEETNKGAVALSHSGSGLKTVLLVLGFLILTPKIELKSLSDFVFAFEELENNLHPSIQRRLVKYIFDRALEHKFPVFL